MAVGVVLLVIGGLGTWLVKHWWRETPPVAAPAPSPPLPQAPKPDLRILDLEPTGGGGTYVDFKTSVANYGTQQCRCELTALVGSEAVRCQPATLDLPANSPPQPVKILVPSPQLGRLVKQFNDDTTLYGETLRVEVTAREHTASREWREHVYTLEENYQRHHIQQRVWRFGRGEETEADYRQEHLEDAIRRREEKLERGPDYEG